MESKSPTTLTSQSHTCPSRFSVLSELVKSSKPSTASSPNKCMNAALARLQAFPHSLLTIKQKRWRLGAPELSNARGTGHLEAENLSEVVNFFRNFPGSLTPGLVEIHQSSDLSLEEIYAKIVQLLSSSTVILSTDRSSRPQSLPLSVAKILARANNLTLQRINLSSTALHTLATEGKVAKLALISCNPIELNQLLSHTCRLTMLCLQSTPAAIKGDCYVDRLSYFELVNYPLMLDSYEEERWQKLLASMPQNCHLKLDPKLDFLAPTKRFSSQ